MCVFNMAVSRVCRVSRKSVPLNCYTNDVLISRWMHFLSQYPSLAKHWHNFFSFDISSSRTVPSSPFFFFFFLPVVVVYKIGIPRSIDKREKLKIFTDDNFQTRISHNTHDFYYSRDLFVDCWWAGHTFRFSCFHAETWDAVSLRTTSTLPSCEAAILHTHMLRNVKIYMCVRRSAAIVLVPSTWRGRFPWRCCRHNVTIFPNFQIIFNKRKFCF